MNPPRAGLAAHNLKGDWPHSIAQGAETREENGAEFRVHPPASDEVVEHDPPRHPAAKADVHQRPEGARPPAACRVRGGSELDRLDVCINLRPSTAQPAVFPVVN